MDYKKTVSKVKALSLLKHENLVELIGYCADGDQRFLVYEHLGGGTVEHLLLGISHVLLPVIAKHCLLLDYCEAMAIVFLLLIEHLLRFNEINLSATQILLNALPLLSHRILYFVTDGRVLCQPF